MSDPVLGTLAYPCDMCGAEPGQDCRENCPGLECVDFSELDLSDIEVSEVSEVPSLDDSQAAFMGAVWRLPFGNVLPDPPDRREYDIQEWMAKMAEWMQTYGAVIKAEVDRLNADSRRAIGLQIEKDMVRSFFGTGREVAA
jgi:hypothetical protein